MAQNKIRAVFMRGGTSKAVVFRRSDLPTDRSLWDGIFLAALGSPDPFGRQLDGMGGGISSLSKVCIVGPSSRSDADVDYTFAQVSVDQAVVDYSGNCGNMSSAIGPFAVDEGLVDVPTNGLATVRIYNANTGKIIVSRFPVRDGVAEVEGNMKIAGVAGSGAPIRLEFLEPGGSRTSGLLPTENPIDEILLQDGRHISASLVDASNPCVFVRAADLGCVGNELPERLEAMPGLLDSLEHIRRQAAVMMGLEASADDAASNLGNPKVAMVAAPSDAVLLTGEKLPAGAYDISVRMLSMGRPHRAIPVTGAVCTAVACRVPGSLLHAIASRPGQIRIGHASGTIVVDAEVDTGTPPRALHGALYRTARRLFEGRVLYVLPREGRS